MKTLVTSSARADPKIHVPDDAALVDTTVELNNDLTRSVVIDELEFVDVACYWTKTSPSVRAQPAFRSHPSVAIVNP